jgi:redox-sensitive bicupin YhaK (pirin superfamily)
MFTSGRGAIHMEETGSKLYSDGGIYHGFQIWLNMPSKHKFIEPSTTLFHPDKMAEIKANEYSAKIVLGEMFGAKSKIETLFPVFYFHINMEANCKLNVPINSTHNAFIYVIKGKIETEGRKEILSNQVVLYERSGNDVEIYSETGAEILLLGGQPHNEAVYAYGPFVMNTEEEIRKCYSDYQTGKMGSPDIVNGKR